jgi:aryl-alcohol dehydrogenase-like predicted oxidoreductase
MEYRYLGNTGLKVSELCLGTMQFGWTAEEALSKQILDAAFEKGVIFIDTADVYSRWAEGNPGGVAETIIGSWLHQSNIARDKLVLATKVRGRMGDKPNDEGLSRQHILHAVDASLKRLGTDYIDLYQTHWPDRNMPIEETLQAMETLIQQGKVRYIGCSNYSAWRLVEALWTSDRHAIASFVCLQPHYNLVHRAEFERELTEVCRIYRIAVIPYSPLAGGFLTGKYRPDTQTESARQDGAKRYFTPENYSLLDVMGEIGTNHNNASISQIALAWLLTNPVITSPIIGPRTLEQLTDNLGAAGLRLSAEEKTRLDQITAWGESD